MEAGSRSVVSSPRFGDDWWQRGIIYQIYPRSFADTDGDGVGDLPGIIDHLDYLGPAGLGIDAIWLSPFYRSPGLDLGYDVSDHALVDPLFGTDEDFDRLVAEAHRRGIRVVLDLVMNHTSDAHRWFVSSRMDRSGPYADWYLWRDPAGFDVDGRPLPPNNWVSFFGGPGWQWEPARGQFYYHTFLAEQPEMDWRTPAVEEAQFDIVRGWLARGVDGFRLDVFNAFLKHPDLPSNPTRPGTSEWRRQIHLHDRDQADFPDLIGRFRSVLDAAAERMSVGEIFDGSVETSAELTTDHHLVFDWELLEADWTAPAIRAAIARRESAFGPDRWPTAVLSNHDRPRHASRFASSITGAATDPIARAAAVLLMTIRGTPFLYYGEELGMTDVEIPLEDSVDPPARWAGPDFVWWDRSPCRTPMPWSSAPGSGFTVGRPWLRFGPDVATRNVAAQAADPTSILATYRSLIALRAATPVLQVGALRLLEADDADVIAYVRETSHALVLVLFNVGRRPARQRLPAADSPLGWRCRFGTSMLTPSPRVIEPDVVVDLAPDEALVLEALR
jgi:alpha-glucosidase